MAPLIKLFKVFMISPKQGATTSIYLSTTSLENISKESGNHFEKSKPKEVFHKDLTASNIEVFWNKSLELIK